MHPELSKRLVSMQLEEARVESGLFGPRVEIEQLGYPVLYIRFANARGEVRLLRFECTDYDYQAMDIDLVHPITRELVTPGEWPLRKGKPFPPHNMKSGAPFLCIEGNRAYYTHEHHRPSATGERWEKHRQSFRVPDLLRIIAEKFRTGEWM